MLETTTALHFRSLHAPNPSEIIIMCVLPPMLFAFCVLLMVTIRLAQFDFALIPAPFHLIGAVLFAAGAIMTTAARLTFHRARTNINTFGEPTHLVTSGPFRWSRNPMYVGLVVALFGVAILFGGAAQLIVAAVFLAVTAFWYVPFEEQAMQSRFREAYSDYVLRTRRWL
jgi:protein-S-isoprenylcysteine O-methyltransferase Ste14